MPLSEENSKGSVHMFILPMKQSPEYSDDLFEMIRMNKAQRQEMERWCDIIGSAKFLEYVEILKKKYPDPKKVPYGVLLECAIYDAKLNVAMYSVFRFIELQFKNECNTRKEILFSALAKKLQSKRRKKGLILEDYKIEKLVGMRNKIMHHEMFIGVENIEEEITNVLSFIKDKKLRKKKIEEINKLVTYHDKKGIEKKIKHYQIHIEEVPE